MNLVCRELTLLTVWFRFRHYNCRHLFCATVPLAKERRQLAVTVARLWETASPTRNTTFLKTADRPVCNDTALPNHHSSSLLILPSHGTGGRPIVSLFVERPGFDHKSVLMRVSGAPSSSGIGFCTSTEVALPVLRFSPASVTPPMLHPSSTRYFHQKGKWAKPANLPKSNSLSQMGEH